MRIERQEIYGDPVVFWITCESPVVGGVTWAVSYPRCATATAAYEDLVAGHRSQ